MSRYAFASSPFGNFAVQVAEARGHLTLEAFRLTPIGNLDAVPTVPLAGVPAVETLDHDALSAEARRQLDARGATAWPGHNPSPEFTVNRVNYTGHVTISRTRFPGSDTSHTFASLSLDDLTPSAQTKLTSWWDSVRDDIVTPEFLAHHALASARVEQSHRARTAERVADELAKAERELSEAGDKVLAALSELSAIHAADRS